MRSKLKKSSKPNLIWRIFSGIVFYASLILLVVLLVLQLPSVQTWMGYIALSRLSEKTNHTINIEKIRVSWLNEAQIKNVFVGSSKLDTLINAQFITIKYDLLDVITGSFMEVDEILGEDVFINYYQLDSPATQSNIKKFLNSLNKKEKNEKSKIKKDITVNHILFSDLDIAIRSISEKSYEGIDPTNMKWQFDEIELGKLAISEDTIVTNFWNFNGEELRSGFVINDLKSRVILTNQSLSIDDLKLHTPHSYVTDSLEFFYNGLDDFAHFVDSVSFILYFENAEIGYKDIKILSGKDGLKSNIGIDGILWGTIGDFNVEDAIITIGDNSFFEGGVSGFGLPKINDTFLLADLTQAKIDPKDLSPYLENDFIQRMNKTFGQIDFNGSFAGYIKDFVARGDFYSKQGKISSDINIKIPRKIDDLIYKGTLEIEELDLYEFFEANYVGKINFIGNIDGHGIKKENANFKLNAILYESEIYGYVYDSIAAEGKFADQFFEGSYSIVDQNVLLNGNAELDFTTTTEIVKVQMLIDTLNAKPLNFSDHEISISSQIDIDLSELDINRFNGSLSIDSTFFRIGERFLSIDSIRFYAASIDSLRTFSFSFPGFNSTAFGDFKITDLIKDIPSIINGYKRKLLLETDSMTLDYSPDPYKITFEATIGGVNDYFESLDLPVRLGEATFIDASYRKSKFSNFSLFMEGEDIAIGNGEFLFPVLEINSSSGIENDKILTNVIFESPAQFFRGVPPTENLLLEAVWNGKDIDLTTAIKQDRTHSDISLNAHVNIEKDSVKIKMNKSKVQLLDKLYDFDSNNQILILDDLIEILDFRISDEKGESIELFGVVSDSTSTNLSLKTEKLDINKIDLFTTSNLSGLLDSRVSVFRSSSSDPFRFEGEFFLDDLMYKELLIGDMAGNSEWIPERESVYSIMEINRENFKTLSVEGQYFPNDTSDQFDYLIDFDKADIRLGDPFLKDNLSEINGFASGRLLVAGNSKTPIVIGNCSVDGEFTINYLKTHYIINGSIDFDEDEIALQRMTLTDRKGGIANLKGRLLHNYFEEINTDFELTTSNFEFLNTSRIDNSLYYGSAYGSGKISVNGQFDDLIIKAEVKTEKNTNFFIPISDASSIQQEAYISFVNFADTVEVEEKDEFLLGLTMDFNVEITPNAYCELIFDQKTGDIIKGRGNGNLKLTMSSDGEFAMFGPLTIEEGSYNFTMANLISKEFSVTPGSSLTWYGDPYNGNLEMEAFYLQRASFFPLDTTKFNDPNSKIPIKVMLNLGGAMETPDIGFDLQFVNESDATDLEKNELEIITSNEQELNRQFMSLVFLRKFSPKESFALGSSGNIGNSFGEFLSNQMSYLISQLDENLEVELDLASLDNEAFNNLQLRLAYTFLNGRLKITRGGDFSKQNHTSGSVLTSIVGDWSIEYSLTKDGKLRIKVFQNTNEQLIYGDNQQALETGISLRYVHSFNSFMELLSINRRSSTSSKLSSNTY